MTTPQQAKRYCHSTRAVPAASFGCLLQDWYSVPPAALWFWFQRPSWLGQQTCCAACQRHHWVGAWVVVCEEPWGHLLPRHCSCLQCNSHIAKMQPRDGYHTALSCNVRVKTQLTEEITLLRFHHKHNTACCGQLNNSRWDQLKSYIDKTNTYLLNCVTTVPVFCHQTLQACWRVASFASFPLPQVASSQTYSFLGQQYQQQQQ